MKCQRITVIALAFLMISLAEPSRAQMTVEKGLKLSRLEGFVYDRSGKPVTDAAVSLVQDGANAHSVTTDKDGSFRIEKIEGKYLLRVVGHQQASAYRAVDIIPSLDSVFSKPTLYVILRPAGCMDDCSSIVTSRRKFEEILRSYRNLPHQ